MIDLSRKRLSAQLDKNHACLPRWPARDAGRIERRIRRGLGRFPSAEWFLELALKRDHQKRVCGSKITERATGKSGSAWLQEPAL